MSLSLVNDIWKLLKPRIESGDTYGAAEILVNYLVEEGVASAHEIKALFRGDKDIKAALDFYLETPEDGLYYRPDTFLEDEDDDDYYRDDLDDDY
jgi:hypothetical protein